MNYKRHQFFIFNILEVEDKKSSDTSQKTRRQACSISKLRNSSKFGKGQLLNLKSCLKKDYETRKENFPVSMQVIVKEHRNAIEIISKEADD